MQFLPHRARPSVRLIAAALLLTLTGASARGEMIGTFEVEAATSAAIVAGNEAAAVANGLNVVDAILTIDEALSGPGIADDGIANLEVDMVFQLDWASSVLNGPGDDLVIFDARFDLGRYVVSSSHDGFTTQLGLLQTEFAPTGEGRDYFFRGTGPISATVAAGAFDLSDLGVPDGVAISSIRVGTSSTGGQSDFLGAGALYVPEPTASLLAVAGAAGFVLRRRQARLAPDARAGHRAEGTR